MVRVSLFFGDDLRGLMIGGRGSAASCGERGLLFFLVVLLGDDFDAGGKGGEAVDVVAVAVGEDDGGHWLRCDLRDVVEELLAAGFCGLCVDDDYAFVSDDDGAVAATALDPVDVRFELVGDEGRCGLRACANAAAVNVAESCPCEVC